MLAADRLLDLGRYPIHEAGPERDRVVGDVRAALDRDGCAVIKGLISPEGIDAMIAEAEGVSDCGFRSFNRTNPYFTQDDPALPADDPA